MRVHSFTCGWMRFLVALTLAAFVHAHGAPFSHPHHPHHQQPIQAHVLDAAYPAESTSTPPESASFDSLLESLRSAGRTLNELGEQLDAATQTNDDLIAQAKQLSEKLDTLLASVREARANQTSEGELPGNDDESLERAQHTDFHATPHENAPDAQTPTETPNEQTVSDEDEAHQQQASQSIEGSDESGLVEENAAMDGNPLEGEIEIHRASLSEVELVQNPELTTESDGETLNSNGEQHTQPTEHTNEILEQDQQHTDNDNNGVPEQSPHNDAPILTGQIKGEHEEPRDHTELHEIPGETTFQDEEKHAEETVENVDSHAENEPTNHSDTSDQETAAHAHESGAASEQSTDGEQNLNDETESHQINSEPFEQDNSDPHYHNEL